MPQNTISFIFNSKIKQINFIKERISPTTTVLKYLRSLPTYKGTKEGCAEGDCGACSVVIAENQGGKIKYSACDSCLIFLPMLQGKQLITVEDLGDSNNLHFVQQAMVDTDGSQCGYCTPGFVLSLFALYKNVNTTDEKQINDYLTGNLCRCTGYRPIMDAAKIIVTANKNDTFSKNESSILKLIKKIDTQESVFIKTSKQKYFQPKTIQEFIVYKTENPNALIVNGATDVGLMVTKQNKLLPDLIDIFHISALKNITENDEFIEYGAGLNLESVRVHSKYIFPALYNMLTVFGSRQIRELGTLGGNVANASPIGDTPPVLMAYDASIKLIGKNGFRTLHISKFITGYRTTDLKSDELIYSIIIPKEKTNTQYKSYKISKRKDLDISTVNGAFHMAANEDGIVKELKLYYGGMAIITKNANKATEFLINKKWNRENIENAMALVKEEFTPITDARSSADGRAIMAANLLLKFWNETSLNSNSIEKF